MKIKLLTIVVCSYICFACSQSATTVSLVYNSHFPVDTIISLDKVPMSPAQINPRCMLLCDGKILVRTSTAADAIYSVFSYPEMKHLSYFGDRSEYVVPLEQSNGQPYLVRSDSLYSYQWVEGDSLKLSSVSYLYNVMGQRMLGVAKLSDNLYAYASSYYDKGMDEFFMINLSRNQKNPKGNYPDSSVNFHSMSDFRSAYAHDIVAKPDGNRLLVFYYRTRRCRIYDNEGILLHDVALNYEPFQAVVDTDMKKQFLHIEDAFVTDHAIYLLCPDTKEEGSACSLLVANWEGEFKGRYHLNQHITYFFVDESLNRFCGINSNDPHHFYLFELGKN